MMQNIDDFLKEAKPISQEELETFKKESQNAIQDMNLANPRPKCRWCGGETKPLNCNEICGPGYYEWNFCCVDCGKVMV